MTLSETDIEEFIVALREDPQLRDRVRSAILADDFLALPGLVRQLSEDMIHLQASVSTLVEESARQRGDIQALTAVVATIGDDLKVLGSEVKALGVEVTALAVEARSARLAAPVIGRL